jgi:hypothetical protein
MAGTHFPSSGSTYLHTHIFPISFCSIYYLVDSLNLPGQPAQRTSLKRLYELCLPSYTCQINNGRTHSSSCVEIILLIL